LETNLLNPAQLPEGLDFFLLVDELADESNAQIFEFCVCFSIKYHIIKQILLQE